MPFGFKVITALHAFSLIFIVMRISTTASMLRGETLSPVSPPILALGMMLGSLIAIIIIAGIYLRKWRTLILWFLGINFVISIITIIQIFTRDWSPYLSKVEIPANVEIDQVVQLAKLAMSAPVAIGLVVALFVWLYTYKHREYFSK